MKKPTLGQLIYFLFYSSDILPEDFLFLLIFCRISHPCPSARPDRFGDLCLVRTLRGRFTFSQNKIVLRAFVHVKSMNDNKLEKLRVRRSFSNSVL